VDSTIQGNNNDTNGMGNYQQNVIKEIQNDNNDIYGEDDNKAPDGKRRGKNKNEKCILF
jgi:hypothetical protein